MIDYIIQLHRQPKMIKHGVFFGLFFLAIYTLLDGLNGGYSAMNTDYGWWLVALNILTNVFMSFVSALMMNLSTNLFHYTGKEGNGSWVPSLSVFFGILTYGCTPCVIAFFASVGIAFSVAVLPLAGYPYKLISVALIIAGLFFVYWEVSRAKCKPHLPTPPKP